MENNTMGTAMETVIEISHRKHSRMRNLIDGVAFIYVKICVISLPGVRYQLKALTVHGLQYLTESYSVYFAPVDLVIVLIGCIYVYTREDKWRQHFAYLAKVQTYMATLQLVLVVVRFLITVSVVNMEMRFQLVPEVIQQMFVCQRVPTYKIQPGYGCFDKTDRKIGRLAPHPGFHGVNDTCDEKYVLTMLSKTSVNEEPIVFGKAGCYIGYIYLIASLLFRLAVSWKNIDPKYVFREEFPVPEGRNPLYHIMYWLFIILAMNLACFLLSVEPYLDFMYGMFNIQLEDDLGNMITSRELQAMKSY